MTIFISIVMSLIVFLYLKSRIDRIEDRLDGKIVDQKTKPPSKQEDFMRQKQEPSPEPQKHFEPQPNWFDNFIDWLKEDWLLKLGALLLLIGFGWLTTYAFLNNWIGPMGRIALGITAGALILILGWWRIKKYVHQGGIFLVLGSTVILLTVFAAREIYQFFTPVSALFIMFLSVLFVALASIRYNTKALAVASLVLAAIAPLLTSASPFNYILLFSYLLIVVLGTIWLVALTGWRELTTVALLTVVFYSLPHLSYQTTSSTGILLLFIYAFAAIFFIANTLSFLRLKGKEILPDLITAGSNGVLLLAWINHAAQQEWRSLIIAAWMFVFTVGAFLVFQLTKNHKPFYVYSGVGIMMLAAATAAELSGAVLTIAYIIEVTLIVFIAYLLINSLRIVMRASLLFIVPIIMSVESIDSYRWVSSGVLHNDFFVLFLLASSLLGLGGFFYSRVKGDNKDFVKFISLLFIAGSIYAYVLLWLTLKAAIQSKDVAITTCLIIYTIIGLITYLKGRLGDYKKLRLYGASLLAFVVGRLMLVDVWNMALAGRITIFFLVGILLMSTAFLGRRREAKNVKSKN